MAQQTIIYTVKKGDTLWGISKKLRIDIDQLAQENGLTGAARHSLKIGQKLCLPHPTKQPDTELTIRIVNLILSPLGNTKLKVSFDDQEKIFTTDENGEAGPIAIYDHAHGIKVLMQNIEGHYEKIAEHSTLPLGKRRLNINARNILIKGRNWPAQGKQDFTTSHIEKIIKQKNQGAQAPTTDGRRSGSDVKRLPSQTPKPLITEIRTEGGNPTHVVAAVFAEENLYLKPANEKYRKFILASAKRYGFTPHALAALINAEAAKLKGGAWNASSLNTHTQAAGLTQFLPITWLEMCADTRSFMNIRLSKEKGYDRIVGKWKDGEYLLLGYKGNKEHVISAEPVLRWRFDAEYSIDSAALYGKINLEKLQKRGIGVDALMPEDLAKVMYLAHHEGTGGASAIIRGELSPERAEKLLKAQIKTQTDGYIQRFNRKPVDAYIHWLFTYVDSHLNVAQFMVNPQTMRARSMAEISKTLGSQISMPPPQPKAQLEAKEQTAKLPAGPAEDWHDPLGRCILRTAKLAGRKSATFGMVRNGGKRAHQGIDLVAVPGMPIYAVSNGRIKTVIRAFSATTGYGAAITLEVDINDLPTKQKEYFQSKYPENELVYFYYAHLSKIHVEEGSYVKGGEILGETGDSGNAKGMNTIITGGHLHFESRYTLTSTRGLDGRLDPLPFLDNCN